jgi:curved DNA-binding protein CbpA
MSFTMAGQIEDYSPAHDSYAILGVDDLCDIEGIRDAYRQLKKLFNPDDQPPHLQKEAKECVARVQTAFDTLKEPALRRAYDANKVLYYGKRFHGKPGRTMEFQKYLKMLQTQLATREAKERNEFELKKGGKSVHDVNCRPEYSTDENACSPFVKAVVNQLQQRKASARIDFELWEERQNDCRSAELRARQMSEVALRAQHGLVMDVLEHNYQRKLHALEQAWAREQTLMNEKHQEELRRLAETQARESQLRKNERKRVRAQYESWCQHVDDQIRYVKRNGKEFPSSDSEKAQPSFHPPHAFCLDQTKL